MSKFSSLKINDFSIFGSWTMFNAKRSLKFLWLMPVLQVLFRPKNLWIPELKVPLRSYTCELRPEIHVESWRTYHRKRDHSGEATRTAQLQAWAQDRRREAARDRLPVSRHHHWSACKTLFTAKRGTGREGDLGIFKGRNRKTWFLTHSTMSPCQVRKWNVKREETWDQEESMKGLWEKQEWNRMRTDDLLAWGGPGPPRQPATLGHSILCLSFH